MLTSFKNDLTTVKQPLVLVLDDYHVLKSPEVHAQLTFLLESQPNNLHLVLISREDPPLPQHHLRARWQVLEIRIKGCLETHWSEWFAGFQGHPTVQNETTLIGPIQDPSALNGLLSRLRDLGMELISVNPVEHSLETAQQSD